MKIDDAKPKVGKESVRLNDILDMVKLPAGKWITVRLLDVSILAVRQHWINIAAGKEKREVSIPKLCISFDPETEKDKPDIHCPYCDIKEGSVFYLANVLVRQLQEDEPAKKPKQTATETKTGVKDPGSKSWTPVQVLRITGTLMKKIQGLKELNKHKVKGETKRFPVAHSKYGVDLDIKHDPNAKGAEQYQVNLGEKVALDDDELKYLVHALDESILDEMGRETEKEANAEVKRMEIIGDKDEDDDDDDGDLLGKKGKKGKPTAKKSSKKVVADEDEDDEDDEDEPPKRSKKAPPKKSKKVVDDDDEDDDEDDEDEDEDEDDEDDSDDGDEDEDEDEDEDDEDEPPKKSSKRPAGKSKAPAKKARKPVDDDDDEDDDDEDDDEDDEDEPPKRGAKKPASKAKSKAPARSKRKSIEDEDDDEDDDDEDDEPPKRGAKKPASKSKAKAPAKKSKRKSSDDDDEDEDDVPF